MKHTKKGSQKTLNKKTKKKNAPKSKKTAVEKSEDVKRLISLLQINQIELEHQNQELRIAEQELEASKNKYVNLFDFSPIPYFVLDQNGMMKEVNLNAGKMFGIDRSKMMGKKFNAYIPVDEREVFNTFMNAIFADPVKHSCKVTVMNKERRVFHVLLEGITLNDSLESGKQCQIVLIDLAK